MIIIIIVYSIIIIYEKNEKSGHFMSELHVKT